MSELEENVEFVLPGDAVDVWDRINRSPAKVLAGLKKLLNRPSPFEN